MLVVLAFGASISGCSGDDTNRNSDENRFDGGADAGSAGAGGSGEAGSGGTRPSDSGAPAEGGDVACVGSNCPVCNDGYCSPGENFANCPNDCFCGNGTCELFEAASNCPDDCPPDPCADGVKNGTESDVDCGGTCFPCSPGFACNTVADCLDPAICRGRCVHVDCKTALDSIPEPGTATFELPVHVVVGPTPVTPVADARVLAEGLTGERVEAVTNASGDVSLTLDAARGPWMLTVAKAGHAVTSVFPVDATFSGDVRIDPLALPGVPAELFDISGTVSGQTVDQSGKPITTAAIDAWEFGSTVALDGSWTSTYGATDPSLPLRVYAMELAQGDLPVNFVGSPDLVRDGAPKTAALVFPEPPAPPTDVTIDVMLPLDGLLPSGMVVPSGVWDGNVVDWPAPTAENAFAFIGKGMLETVSPGRFAWRIRSYSVDGASPDAAHLPIPVPAAGYLLNLYTNAPTMDGAITVGRIECLAGAGTTLDDFSASADAQGYDALIVHIGESAATRPQMRVIVRPIGGKAVLPWLPHLPTGITLEQIGIPQYSYVSSLAMLASVEGPAWSTQILNAGVPEYRYTVAGSYGSLMVGAALTR